MKPLHLALLLAVLGCGANKAAVKGGTGPGASMDVHQPPASEEHVQAFDLHRRGKPDAWVYTVSTKDDSGRPIERKVRHEADLNGDGKVDMVEWFNESGEKVRETLDLDFDGKVDDTLFFEKGKKIRTEKDLDGDGRIDTWSFYDGEQKLVRKERDVKGSGKVDYWEYWENGSIDRIGEDLDGDGAVDRWTKGPAQTTEGAKPAK
jgi:EF hand